MPFTSVPWSSPESELSSTDFCKVCLIDENPDGAEKIKAKCKLPIRSRPGAPINSNAVYAAAGGYGVTRVTGTSPAAKKKAANRLISLYKEMGETAPEAIYRVAGKARPKGG